jgi:hypothetical protein
VTDTGTLGSVDDVDIDIDESMRARLAANRACLRSL